MLSRRSFIAAGGTAAALATMGFPNMAFARAATDRRFVFVIQRGAADGLHIVAPTGDPAYAGLRGDFAQDLAAGTRLGTFFMLHPALAQTAKMYADRQALFVHGRLEAGQRVLVHGAAGAVGSMATQLAREAGAWVIGTGRAADREKALDFGVQEFVDLGSDDLEEVGGVDLVLDVIGGDIGKRSARLVRAGGTLVSIVGPSEARPTDGLAVDFVVEADRGQLGEIVQRVRDGRLRTNIGTVSSLDDAIAAFTSTERHTGKTIIRIRP